MNKNKSCPSTTYTGISNEESQVILNDIIDNKKELVKAINNKGGNAEPSDSMNRLADKIRRLVPAQPVFADSDTFNPYWTNLVEKIGEHYREDRKYCWAFSFLGKNETVELSGGEYYICSDGFEADASQSHTFGKNLDKTKKDHWVIIYTRIPIYIFTSTFRLLEAVFYHTSQDRVFFQNMKLFHILQEGKMVNEDFDTPNYYCQNVPVSFYKVPEGTKKINFGASAFDGCKFLRQIIIPEGLTELTIGSSAFRNAILNEFIVPPVSEKISFGSTCFNNVATMQTFEIKDSPDASITFGATVFAGAYANKIIIGKSKRLSLSNNVIYPYTAKEIWFENPSEGFSMNNPSSDNTSTLTFHLGEGWNWGINLTRFTYQTVESMVQNCEALADRTGLTKSTLTYGATKLALLAQERPDMIELAQAKNWNIV